MSLPRKSLGQHWLHDEATLNYICDAAELVPTDMVLEIGPGTGTLTKKLFSRGAKVLAIEKDESLAANLSKTLMLQGLTLQQTKRLEVVQGDILKVNLSQLPIGYKVVANIPYYLTSNILRVLSESSNPPTVMVLLVQKEVAERIAAGPRQMSLLAVSVQLYYRPELGQVVPAKLFEPPPKVDSQVVILKRHPKPLFPGSHPGNNGGADEFFRMVKAGFSQRRKKLRNSLAGGLKISIAQADDLLKKAGVSPDARAQELSLQDWHKIYQVFH